MKKWMIATSAWMIFVASVSACTFVNHTTGPIELRHVRLWWDGQETVPLARLNRRLAPGETFSLPVSTLVKKAPPLPADRVFKWVLSIKHLPLSPDNDQVQERVLNYVKQTYLFLAPRIDLVEGPDEGMIQLVSIY